MGNLSAREEVTGGAVMLLTSCVLISLNSALAQNVVGTVVEQQSQLVRNPKVFFPLTTTTVKATTTLAVYTNCYFTTATLVACGKRKMLLEDMIAGDEKVADIKPDSTALTDWEEDEVEAEEPEIDSILRDDLEEDETDREGKFMLYWTTVTKTSYATAYTQTSTIATVICTPSGFSLYSACGKKKKK